MRPSEEQEQNHPKVALIHLTQPLELVYSDLSGPANPESGAGNSYLAKCTDHHSVLILHNHCHPPPANLLDDAVTHTRKGALGWYEFNVFAWAGGVRTPDWNIESTAYRTE